MIILKQNTAIVIPFKLINNGDDAVVGELDAGFTTKRLSKGSGAFGALTGTITEMEFGWYQIPLSATDTDTLGLLSLSMNHPAGASNQVFLQFRVEANLLDDLQASGIRANMAFPGFSFPMVLAVDHSTAAPGLTVTGERSVDGASFAPVTGVISEVGSGVYSIDLTAADTNGAVITYKFSGPLANDTLITVITI